MSYVKAAAEVLSRYPTKSNKHMWHEERAGLIEIRLGELLEMATRYGCEAAAWAYEFAMHFATADVVANPDLPADDDEPVTEEWLLKAGFVNVDGEFFRNGLHLTKMDEHWRWQVGGNENWWEWLRKPTRGQVCDILSALGIEVKP